MRKQLAVKDGLFGVLDHDATTSKVTRVVPVRSVSITAALNRSGVSHAVLLTC